MKATQNAEQGSVHPRHLYFVLCSVYPYNQPANTYVTATLQPGPQPGLSRAYTQTGEKTTKPNHEICHLPESLVMKSANTQNLPNCAQTAHPKRYSQILE